MALEFEREKFVKLLDAITFICILTPSPSSTPGDIVGPPQYTLSVAATGGGVQDARSPDLSLRDRPERRKQNLPQAKCPHEHYP